MGMNPVLPTVAPVPQGMTPQVGAQQGATQTVVPQAGATPGVVAAAKSVAPNMPAAPSVPAGQGTPKAAPAVKPANNAAMQDAYVKKIVEKIRTSENILVALSRDPSVDEIAAAIGLTLFLDTIQKHTTAIYSGMTPDALQFLQPEGTFETNTDSLRDFIIALNKEKADSLRYKVEGDFVKVFITPYKAMITEEDLEFSYGDFNVNLVLALGVPTAADLDSALAEHGRIMHDATIVDITCDAPGKFGEIEWSDPGASSVSEMITKLIFAMQGQDATVDKEIATALLTGIVAATGRFSNDRTNSDTMQLASKLMSMGADQQLISAHVMDNDSSAYSSTGMMDTSLRIEREPQSDKYAWGEEEIEVAAPEAGASEAAPVKMTAEDVTVQPDVPVLPEVKTEEESKDKIPELLTPQTKADMAAAAKSAVSEAITAATANAAAVGANGVGIEKQPETEKKPDTAQAVQAPVVAPAPVQTGPKDYAAMIEQALAEPLPVETAASAAGLINSAPVNTPAQQMNASSQPVSVPMQPVAQAANTQVNTPEMSQPTVVPVDKTVQSAQPAQPGVVLPPPPAPTAGDNMMPPAPDAFQIPGMH